MVNHTTLAWCFAASLVVCAGTVAITQDTAAFAMDAAKRYEELNEWERAEAQYLEAAQSKDAATRRLALSGVERMRRRAQESTAALDLARRYERLGEWAKAEEQYVEAGKSAAGYLARLAGDGAQRMRAQQRVDTQAAALSMAKEYEQQGLLQRAEQQYMEAAKSDRIDIVREALEGVRRTSESPRISGTAAAFDRLAGHAGRVLGLVVAAVAVVSLVALVVSVVGVRRSIRVVSLQAGSDESNKKLAFWLACVRGQLLAAQPPAGGMLVAGIPALPFIELPGLPPEFEAIGEIDFGSARLPLQQILTMVRRPRVQIVGYWSPGDTAANLHGRAFAGIERRRPFHYELVGSVEEPIAAAAGPVQESDLELFAYAILLEAVYVHVT